MGEGALEPGHGFFNWILPVKNHSSSLTFFGAGLAITSVYWLNLVVTALSLENLAFIFLCFSIFVSGCFQAFGWPSAVKGMSEFLSSQTFQALVPLWTTCCLLGSSLGGLLIGQIYTWLGSSQNIPTQIELQPNCTVNNKIYLIPDNNQTDFINLEANPKINWRLAFLIPGCFTLLMSIVTFIFFPTTKTAQAKKSNSVEDQPLKSEESSSQASSTMIPMSQVVQELPAIKLLALSYAFAKGSRYWYFYWAPDWLVNEGGFSVAEATYLSIALDIGGALALVVLGPISVKNKFIKKPIPPLYLAAISSASCIPMIFVAKLALNIEGSLKIPIVSVVLGLLGFVVALSDPVYSAMCTNESADIDGRNLHASAAGFVNGVGTMGAVILNPLASFMAGLDPVGGYKYALMTVGTALGICTVTTILAHRQLVAARIQKEGGL